MTKPDLTERNDRIVQMREEGLSMQEIANEYGLTRASISIILKSKGIKSKKIVSKVHKAKWAAKSEARIIEAHITFLQFRNEGISYKDIKEYLKQDAYLKVMKIIKQGNPKLYQTIRQEQIKESNDRIWENRDEIMAERHKRGHYDRMRKNDNGTH